MLKKVFASFSCALLIFSASVLPCFASVVTGPEVQVNTDSTFCTVNCYIQLGGPGFDFNAPVNTLIIGDTGVDTLSGVHMPISPALYNLSSFILQEDVTLYWRVSPFLYNNDGVLPINMWNENSINTYLPEFWYGAGYNGSSTPDTPTNQGYVTALALGDDTYGHNHSRAYRAKLPAITPNGNFTENFSIYYPTITDNDPNGTHAHWNTRGAAGSLFIHVDLFQIVHTTDATLLKTLDKILAEAEEANVNLNNILGALDSIIVQLTDLGLTADEIASAVNAIDLQMDDVLVKLSRIEYSVQAIEYILTQALADESESLNNNVQQATGLIDSVENADEYYYETTTGVFNQLHFDNGLDDIDISNALTFVGMLFSEIWTLLDSNTGFIVLYTFPLILGISLLVVGRISRTRNSTKKDDD